MTGPDDREKGRVHLAIPGRILAGLRNNFLAGVVVIAPIGLTAWFLWTLAGWVDGFVLPFVPSAYRPETLVNRWFGGANGEPVVDSLRGVGVILFLVFTILVGWIAKGIVGRSFLRWGEDIVGRLPVIRSIYNALKQISETVFSQRESSFQKACLIPFPRDGSWALAFISTEAKGEVQRHLFQGDEIISVFMPTTPNPTSGFLIFVPRSQVHELEMSVEDAAKLVISAGLVYPQGTEPPGPDAIPLAVRKPQA